MTQSPMIQFGLNAQIAAMKAKSGQLTLRDRLNLARAALRHAEIDSGVCDQVEFFLATVDGDAASAGARLSEFLADWLPDDNRKADDGVSLFDWQKRADLR